MKDLTNFPIISANQENNCSISAIIGINDVNIDDSKNLKSNLTSAITSSATELTVAGVYTGFTGYITIDDEIIYTTSALVVGENTTLTIQRGMLGTVAQEHSINSNVYSIEIMRGVSDYKYNEQTDGSESDLFGVNMDNGSCKIECNPKDWSKFNPSRIYNYKNKRKIFIFEGINNQFIKTFEGVTSRRSTNNKYRYITIEFKSDLWNYWNESIESTKVYYSNTIKEVLEDLFNGYTVEFMNGTTVTDYLKLTNFKTSKYEKYSDLLNAIAKITFTRIRFTSDNKILISSDLKQSNIAPVATIDRTLIDIDDSETSQIIYNKISSTYYEKKELYDINDFKEGATLKYIKFKASKTVNTPTQFIENNIWKTITVPDIQAKYLQIGDYALLIDNLGKEFWGMVTNITTTTVDVAIGLDKDFRWDYRGKLETLYPSGNYAPSSYTLYYGKSELPIVWKMAYTQSDNTKDYDLQRPILPIVTGAKYNLINTISSSDTTIICSGDLSNYNSWIKIDNEWIYVKQASYDGTTNTTLTVKRGELDTTPAIHTSGTNNVITTMFDNIEEFYNSFAFTNIGEKEYAGIVGRVDNIWNSWFDNSDLLYAKLYTQADNGLPIYLQSNKISNTASDDTQVIKYTSFDNSGLKLNIQRASDNESDFRMLIMNSLTEIDGSTMTPITPITVTGTLIEVDNATYTNAKAGNVLILSPITNTSDPKYDVYTSDKTTKWTVLGKAFTGGKYYIYTNMAYPPINGTHFDFYMFDNSKVIHLNELAIRGNPIMQKKQEFTYENTESIEENGTMEYNIEAENYSESDFKLAVDYIKNGYSGINNTNTRYKFKVELPSRLDLQTGDAIYLSESLYYGVTNQKAIITSNEVSNTQGKRTNKYTFITVGDYNVNENNIKFKSTLNYTPATIPEYTHIGTEGTNEQTKTDNGKVVSLTDKKSGEVFSFKEISNTVFSATVNTTYIARDDKSATISLTSVTSDAQYQLMLLREGVVGYIKLNGEYLEYKAIGNSFNTIQIQSRGLFDTEQREISYGNVLTFMQVISKTTEEGFYATEAVLGNGSDAQIKVSKDKVDIFSKGIVDISNNSNKNQLHFDEVDNESFISMNNGQQQIGKVTGLIGKSDFNGIFTGDKTLANKKYMYYDGEDLVVESNYINKVAYVSTGLEFLGACDSSKATVNSQPNPFYNKEINGIVFKNELTGIVFDDLHFTEALAGQIKPVSAIKFIDGNNFKIFCNYKRFYFENMEVRNINFDYLGSNIDGRNFSIEGSNVSFINNIIEHLQKPMVFINNSTVDTIAIKSMNVFNNVYGIFSASGNINNIVINMNDGYLYSAFKYCRNVSNVTITTTNNYDGYIFSECTNLKNIRITQTTPRGNMIVFDKCENVDNVRVLGKGKLSIETGGRETLNISNCIVEGIDGSNTFSVDNINGLSNYRIINYVTTNSLSLITNVDYDSCDGFTNPYENKRKLVSNNELIPTASYNTYTIPLSDQNIFVTIKQGNTNYVLEDTDLDFDVEPTGSNSVCKLYNDSGTWKLFLLSNDRDIIGGSEIWIRFSVNANSIDLMFKSESANKYLTCYTEII